MRILFALPGLHRIRRGAEVAFESIAQEIAAQGEHEVTLAGSGTALPRAYNFVHVPAIPREQFEWWPKVPFLRSEYAYEDLTFALGLLMRRLHIGFDVTVTCNYPYTNWILRAHGLGTRRPAHVFVTQNGDWPAYQQEKEYKFFWCEGLICTNPVYWARNRGRWFSTLIPNGINPNTFHTASGDRLRLGLPEKRSIILMVSALEEGKRVLEAIRAVACVDDAFLLIAGDGRLRTEVDRLAAELLPGRFLRKTFAYEEMPVVYRSAEVFLHTAIRESFGNVYIEALASGTPIVAHDDEVSRWILNGNAYLVDTTSEAALVKALVEALRTSKVGALKRSYVAHSKYSWETVAAAYRDFLLEVAARYKRL